MKAKAFFSYLLLFALLASCPALSASAEESLSKASMVRLYPVIWQYHAMALSVSIP